MDKYLTADERAAIVEQRQADCKAKMIAEGKHVFTGKKLASYPHSGHQHIADWVKPTIKAIARKQKQQAKQKATVTTLLRKVSK